MSETEMPKATADAAHQFIEQLLRHHFNALPDMPQHLEEAAAEPLLPAAQGRHCV